MPQAATALSNIGISINDMEGQIRPVSDILDDLGKKWNTLSKEEQQNTGIKVAGTHQLSRFNAFMLNYQTAIDATTTALNSNGSAINEQEKYNKGLEARINRLGTAWYGLADSLGQSILYDGIVVLTSTFEGATKAGDSTVTSIGALPVIFGVVGSAVALMSGRFSTWTGTMIANRATAMATTVANGSLSASLLGIAATSTVAQRALMMTGVGAALVAIGVAFSFLTSTISKHIQEQEEFDSYLKKNTDALGINKESTEELIEQYNNLTEAKESGSWDSKKEEEYLAVQQKLGDFFPSLIDSIDSTGQSHIKNKEAIESEIKATEDLLEAKNKVIVENSGKEFEKLSEGLDGSWNESFSNYIYGSLESRIKEQKQILEFMNDKGSDEGAIAKQELKLKQLERQYQQTSEEIKGHIFTVANAMSDTKIDKGLSDMLQEFVGGLQIDTSELESFSKEIGSIQLDLQNALSSGNTEAFDATVKKLNDLASETDNFDSKYGKLVATIENGKITLTDSAGVIHVVGDNIDATGESAEEAEEKLSGYMSSISKLNGILEDYKDTNQLTADTMTDLISTYPELIAYIGDEAEFIKQLEKIRLDDINLAKQQLSEKMSANETFYNNNLKALEIYTNEHFKFYDGDLKQFKNLAQAKAEVETELITKLAKSWGVYYNTASESFDSERSRTLQKGGTSAWMPTAEEFDSVTKANSELKEFRDTWSNFTLDKISLDFDSIGTNAAKSAKSTKESIYYTDKFKQSIDALNSALEKQNAIKNAHSKHSKEHQKAIKNEISLNKQLLKVTEDQAKALAKQIKSGKIKQTGTVSSSTSSSSGKASGNSTEANIWNFFKGKGLSDSASAGIMGNLKLESGLSTTAVNKSSGATGIAQWLGGRLTGLKSYAKTLGTSWTDLNTQLEWLWKELNGADATTKSILNKNGGLDALNNMNASSAALLFEKSFERSGGAALTQRKNNANDYYNKFNGSGTVSSSSSSSGGSVDNSLQAIDGAKSDLLSLQSDIVSYQSAIAELEQALVDSIIASYSNARVELQYQIDDEIKKREELNNITSRWHSSMKTEQSLIQKQIKSLASERSYLQSLMKSTKLTAAAKDELSKSIQSLNLEIKDMQLSIKNLTFERIEGTMRRFSETIDDINYELDRSNAIMTTLEEGSPAYTSELKKQASLLKQQKDELIAQRESLQKSLLIHDLTSEQYKSLIEQIEDLSLEIWGVEGSIVSLGKTLKDSTEKNASEAADALIDAYKEYLNEKKDMHMDALDKESEAEDERHDKVMTHYDEEREAFNKLVQAKLDEIDRQESERDYNKEIDDLESERNEITDKINLLSMDDSFEAKADLKKLQEELDNINESIAEKQHDREVDLRKENLNDILEKEQEKFDELEKIENERHENENERIDELKEYWSKFYEDQLNDERYFAKMKEDIIAGNFNNLSAEFQSYIKEMEDTMPSIENTLNGTMVAVGTAIRKNIIDNLKEALGMLGKVQDDANSGGSGSGGTGGGTVSKGLSNADLLVLTGKYYREQLVKSEPDAVKRKYIMEKATNLATSGRNAGSTINNTNGEDLNTLISKMTPEEKVQFGKFLQSSGYKYVSSDYLQDDVTEYGKLLENSAAKFGVGGYTGKFQGGKAAILHEEEVILNKKETKEFFKYAPILEKISSFIPTLNLPSMKQQQLLNNTNMGTGNTSIQFFVENMNATKAEATNFANDFMKEMKRKRGY